MITMFRQAWRMVKIIAETRKDFGLQIRQPREDEQEHDD